MEPVSAIVKAALDKVTRGTFPVLPSLAIRGLLDDFQYAWLRRLAIPYDFTLLEIARGMCNAEDEEVFAATHCASIKGVRRAFSAYISKWHKDDDRVILSITYDGKKTDAEWVEMATYLKARENAASPKDRG
jgi:uncharacterized linocin/CFP29 family protein